MEKLFNAFDELKQMFAEDNEFPNPHFDTQVREALNKMESGIDDLTRLYVLL